MTKTAAAMAMATAGAAAAAYARPPVSGTGGEIKHRSLVSRLSGAVKNKAWEIPTRMHDGSYLVGEYTGLSNAARKIKAAQRQIRHRFLPNVAPSAMRYEANILILHPEAQMDPLSGFVLRNGKTAMRLNLGANTAKRVGGPDFMVDYHSMKNNPRRGEYGINKHSYGMKLWTNTNNSHVSFRKSPSGTTTARVSARNINAVKKTINLLKKRDTRENWIKRLPNNLKRHIVRHVKTI